MTGISEHTKSILRAIADEKTIEYYREKPDGSRVWERMEPGAAAPFALWSDSLLLRIKPETRSINGVTFAAPLLRFGALVPKGHLKINQKSYCFESAIDADSAALAICDALEGVTR